MKLIQSKAELITQGHDLQSIYRMIELAGRTCYKSEANITYDSAAEFVGRMIKSGHTAMLEHGTVYLLIPYWNNYEDTELASFFRSNPYSKACGPMEGSVNWHITTNYRVLVENNILEKCKPFICAPTKYHSLRISMRFITDRGLSHEIVRHRVFSFAQESTRYCNYSKEKFNNEITFIIPSWLKENVTNGSTFNYYNNIDEWQASEDANTANFLQSIAWAEENYLTLIGNGKTPQEARQVLPNALKTEIVMTGFVSDWKHFFDLRYFGTTGKPHPDMLELTTKAKAVLEEAGLWGLINNNV